MKSPDRKRKQSGLVERAPISYDTQKHLEQIASQHQGNTAANQRERLRLALLTLGSITTLEATRHLDIIHPPARAFELRATGHPIRTDRVQQATGCGKLHRVGLYVLEVRQ